MTPVARANIRDRPASMFPRPASDDLSNHAFTDAEKVGQTVDSNALRIQQTDGNDFIFRQFGMRASSSQQCSAMPSGIFPVGFSGVPSEIAELVVHRVAIKMTSLHPRRAWPNEGKQDQAMGSYLIGFPISEYGHVKSIRSSRAWSKDVRDSRIPICLSVIGANSPPTAGFIAWEIGDRLPFFCRHAGPPKQIISIIPHTGEVDTITISDRDAADKEMARRTIRHFTDGRQPVVIG